MINLTKEAKERKLFSWIIDYETFYEYSYSGETSNVLKNIKLLRDIEQYPKGSIFKSGKISLHALLSAIELHCYKTIDIIEDKEDTEDTKHKEDLILCFNGLNYESGWYIMPRWYYDTSERYYKNLEYSSSKEEYLKRLDDCIKHTEGELSTLIKRKNIIEKF